MKASSPQVKFRTRVVIGYLFAFMIAVTWPGTVPFNRFEPQVLGLPFNLAWSAAWVLLGFVLLLWLDRAVSQAEDSEPSTEGPG